MPAYPARPSIVHTDRALAVEDDLRPQREAAAGVLHGWSPGNNHDQLECAGGRLMRMDFDNQTVWWQDLYRTTTDCRST